MIRQNKKGEWTIPLHSVGQPALDLAAIIEKLGVKLPKGPR